MALTILFRHLLGYDGFILLLGIFNGFVAYQLKLQSQTLYERLSPTVYLPIHQVLPQVYTTGHIDLHQLRAIKEKETKLSYLFNSITLIFPLLGILGTVMALLRLLALDDFNLVMNFSTALTSTFWGLLLGIIFKAVGGVINHMAESNQEMLTLLISRIDTAQKADATGTAYEEV